MAQITHDLPAASLWARLAASVSDLFSTLVAARAASVEAEMLYNMSDSGLEARHLRRDEIADFVAMKHFDI